MFIYLLMIQASLSMTFYLPPEQRDRMPLLWEGQKKKQNKRKGHLLYEYGAFLSFHLYSLENRRNKNTIRYRIQSLGKLMGEASPTPAPLLPAVILLPPGLTSTHLPTHFPHLLLQSGTSVYRETSTASVLSFPLLRARYEFPVFIGWQRDFFLPRSSSPRKYGIYCTFCCSTSAHDNHCVVGL